VKHNLPYYTKFVLCAAYLASFTPPRQDQIFFMKSSEKKKRRRNATSKASGKLQKNRKIPRNLLAPSPFPLDRLLAILRALLPHPMTQNADIFTQIATLSSLRLLLKASTTGTDALDPGCKWRVNCGWEYVVTLGRSVGLEMRDWIASSQDWRQVSSMENKNVFSSDGFWCAAQCDLRWVCSNSWRPLHAKLC